MDFLDMLAQKINDHWERPATAGKVAFGVKGKNGVTRWMLVDCGNSGKISWSLQIPEFEAAIGLDEDAAANVAQGRLPSDGQLCIKTGDEALLQSILSHYFESPTGLSPLALRAGGY